MPSSTLLDLVVRYSEDQPRDAQGRFGESGDQTKLGTMGFKAGPVKSLMGGNSKVFLATLSDGTKVVVKPNSGLNPGGFGQKVFPDQLAREAAAHDVARLVGMTDLLPATTVRDDLKEPWASGRASVQAYISNARPAEDGATVSDHDVTRTAMFDFVTGNLDRHAGNWLQDADGHTHLIDHGYTFPERNSKINGITSEAIDQADARRSTGSTIDPKLQATWENQKSAILSAAKARGISDGARKTLATRLDYATAEGRKWGDLYHAKKGLFA